MVMRGLSSISRIITSSESGVLTSSRRLSIDIRFKTALVALRERAAGVSIVGVHDSMMLDGGSKVWFPMRVTY